ncbi:MAG: hypothetical protein KDA25_04185, partial [Phycisphaerales bacterium]|nr:hypothetical protein [Phycisphaerales bacterium]
MGDPARERARQVASTANRLRLVQIDFADESPEVRQQYLVDEIERALSRTDPDQREAFLQELEYAFPTWDAWGSAPAPAAAPSAAPPTDAREDRDPSYHLRRLVELSAGLSAEEKAAIVERLRRAGLAPASGGDWPQEAAAALRERLRLPESAHVDPERTVELVSLLVHDLAGPLDDIVWRTWKQIAPRSDLRRG